MYALKNKVNVEVFSNTVDKSKITHLFNELFEFDVFRKPGKILITGNEIEYETTTFLLKGFDITLISNDEVINSLKHSLSSKEKINFLYDDLISLPSEYNNTFDYVYAKEINLKSIKDLAAKFSSLIKKGGRCIIILHNNDSFQINVKEFYKTFSEFFQLEIFKREKSLTNPLKEEILQVYYKKPG